MTGIDTFVLTPEGMSVALRTKTKNKFHFILYCPRLFVSLQRFNK